MEDHIDRSYRDRKTGKDVLVVYCEGIPGSLIVCDILTTRRSYGNQSFLTLDPTLG